MTSFVCRDCHQPHLNPKAGTKGVNILWARYFYCDFNLNISFRSYSIICYHIMFPLFSHHAYLDPQREVLTDSALHMYMTFGIKMHAVAKKTRNNHTLVHFIRKNKIHKHLFKMTIIAILLLLYYYHDYNYFIVIIIIVIIIIIIIIILCYLREIKYK